MVQVVLLVNAVLLVYYSDDAIARVIKLYGIIKSLKKVVAVLNFSTSEKNILLSNCACFVYFEGGEGSMESRQGFARHGHSRPSNHCAPIKLAATLGDFSRSGVPTRLEASLCIIG